MAGPQHLKRCCCVIDSCQCGYHQCCLLGIAPLVVVLFWLWCSGGRPRPVTGVCVCRYAPVLKLAYWVGCCFMVCYSAVPAPVSWRPCAAANQQLQPLYYGGLALCSSFTSGALRCPAEACCGAGALEAAQMPFPVSGFPALPSGAAVVWLQGLCG
jgi:hypothetical protein